MFEFKSIAKRSMLLTAAVIFAITLATPTFAQTTISKIEQMTGWESCTVCAGPGGAGAVATYSLQKGIASPSMDGNSTQFNLGGTTAYTSALWWKQLGAQSSAHHFVYDVYFYLKNPKAAQALEFDVNQSVGGHKYIFGTECSIKGYGQWRIWSAATHWTTTGIPCGLPTAFAWHHITWEFERTVGNMVKFVSVTLDGKKSYVNRTFAPKASSVNEMNVAFQMDGDKYQTDYSTWLDQVSLKYW